MKKIKNFNPILNNDSQIKDFINFETKIIIWSVFIYLGNE